MNKVTVSSGSIGMDGDLPKEIGSPATAALRLEGLVWLKDIAAMSDKELLSLHGVGPKAVRILREAIAKRQ